MVGRRRRAHSQRASRGADRYKKQVVDRLRKNYYLLHVLKDASPAVRKGILGDAKQDLITTVGDCSKTILNGRLQLSPACKQKLKKYKASLRKLQTPNSVIHWKHKRRILNQKGGFLGALLTPILTSLLTKMFS